MEWNKIAALCLNLVVWTWMCFVVGLTKAYHRNLSWMDAVRIQTGQLRFGWNVSRDRYTIPSLFVAYCYLLLTGILDIPAFVCAICVVILTFSDLVLQNYFRTVRFHYSSLRYILQFAILASGVLLLFVPMDQQRRDDALSVWWLISWIILLYMKTKTACLCDLAISHNHRQTQDDQKNKKPVPITQLVHQHVPLEIAIVITEYTTQWIRVPRSGTIRSQHWECVDGSTMQGCDQSESDDDHVGWPEKCRYERECYTAWTNSTGHQKLETFVFRVCPISTSQPTDPAGFIIDPLCNFAVRPLPPEAFAYGHITRAWWDPKGSMVHLRAKWISLSIDHNNKVEKSPHNKIWT